MDELFEALQWAMVTAENGESEEIFLIEKAYLPSDYPEMDGSEEAESN